MGYSGAGRKLAGAVNGAQPALASLADRQVLVTGATGFIGSQLVPRLVECQARVIAAAPGLGWRPWVARLVQEGKVTFVEADALTPAGADFLSAYLTDADYVVHLARVWAQGNTPLELAVDETVRNLLGSIRFLAIAARRGLGIAYSSSVEVYGSPGPLPKSEDQPLRPTSPYGVAKMAVESFLKAHAASAPNSIAILRYATVYGPGELAARAVPNFIRAALQGQPPVVDGEGLDVRDYVYVRDVVEATLRVLAASADGVHVFNVGTGLGCSTIELAQLVLRVTGVPLEPICRPSSHVPLEIVCDISRAQRELGYFPAYTLEQGVSAEAGWFRANPALWCTTKDS